MRQTPIQSVMKCVQVVGGVCFVLFVCCCFVCFLFVVLGVGFFFLLIFLLMDIIL